MNVMKKALAILLCMCTVLGCTVFTSFAEDSTELGTEENPENANDKYFSGANCYLLNIDLEEGDTDGYWYEFTADSAGYYALDVTAKDSSYVSSNNFQVTVECEGKTYYAFDEVFTRPIVPFRLSRGNVMKIHITATPDENGVYPKLEVYANITTAYGNTNDPIMIKSTEGFVANVQAQKTLVYTDGTNGGLYGSKGIEVYASNDDIALTEITVNSTVYTDVDRDGKIELTLPGNPNAQIAVHPSFSIFNGSYSDVTYTIKVVDSASESDPPLVTAHTVTINGIETMVDEGTTINLSAESFYTENNRYYRFLGWTGDVDGVADTASASTTVTVNGDLSINAGYIMIGDIIGDSNLNAADSNTLRRMAAGQVASTLTGDIDGDGKILPNDSNLLGRMVGGSWFPTE